MSEQYRIGGEVTTELESLYERAEADGYFIVEFDMETKWWAAVGDQATLDAAGIEDSSQLGLGELVNISLPGRGDTRVEAVENGIKKWQEHKHGPTTDI